MNWTQHLFSMPTKGDSFRILTDSADTDAALITRVTNLLGNAEKLCAFMLDCGNRTLIGLDGRIADVPEASKYAFECVTTSAGRERAGRSIAFTHGYLGSKGAAIPALTDLIKQQGSHLKEILRRANEGGEDPVRIAPAVFQAQGVSTATTDWDKHAKEFVQGKRRFGDCALFKADGSLLRFVEGDDKISATEIAGRAAAEFKKKTSEVQPRTPLFKILAVSLGAVVAAVAIWGLTKGSKGQAEAPTESRQEIER